MFLLTDKKKDTIKNKYIESQTKYLDEVIEFKKREIELKKQQLEDASKDLDNKLKETNKNLDKANKEYIASLSIELTDEQKRKIINKELTKKQEEFSKYFRFVKDKHFNEFDDFLKIIIKPNGIEFRPFSNKGFSENLSEIIKEFLQISGKSINKNTSSDKIRQIFESFPCYDIITINKKINHTKNYKNFSASYTVIMKKNNTYLDNNSIEMAPPPSYQETVEINEKEPSAPVENKEIANIIDELYVPDNKPTPIEAPVVSRSNSSVREPSLDYTAQTATITILGDFD